MKIIQGKKRVPRRILHYGGAAIGKSTWAASAPGAIVVQTEDGLSDIGVDRSPLLKKLSEVNAFLSDLATQPHDYKWVVIDTIDWLEHLIFAQVSADNNKNSIEEIGYAKGYKFAILHWQFILKSLDHLRNSRGMGVILLAHSKIVKVSPADGDPYDRNEPDLHANAVSLIREWVDECFFATQPTITKKEDAGFNKKKIQAIGSRDRVIYTCNSPTHLAKRRMPLPDEMPLNFAFYYDLLKKYYADPAPHSIAGIVQNGHSKHAAQADLTESTTVDETSEDKNEQSF